MLEIKKMTDDQFHDFIVKMGIRNQIAENMQIYGGSFVKGLAECVFHADPFNFIKLVKAFRKYFEDYMPDAWKNLKSETGGLD